MRDYDDKDPLLGDSDEGPADWDVFENRPNKSSSGSDVEAQWMSSSIKILKLFTIFFVFLVVLTSAVFSKASLLLMVSQIRKNVTRPFCNADLDVREQYVVTIPEEQRVLWVWMIIFAYCVPELGVFVRSLRITLFKSWQVPSWEQWLSLGVTETLPAIGSALLIFVVFVELDVVKAAMLTNAVCFIPGLIGLASRNVQEPSKISLELVLDVISIGAQISSFVVWPLVENRPVLYFIPLAVGLISVGWWETYLSEDSSIKIIQFLAKQKVKFPPEKYFMYIFISLWKCLVFFITVLVIFSINDEQTILFDKFSKAFSDHAINVTGIEPLIGSSVNYSDAILSGSERSYTNNVWIAITIFLVNISSTYICYAFAKWACKVMIQGFAFAFPINLTVPVLLSVLIAFCGAYNKDECAFNNFLPNYLFFVTPNMYFLNDFISQQHSWIWLVWLLSQAWITIHNWTSNPNSDKLCSTEQIFMKPLYDAFLIDQSIAMNRRRKVFVNNYETFNPSDLGDDETRIYACGTMWHETAEEMMEFLKSVMRMDDNQFYHRMVREHLKIKRSDFYKYETHIFVDDAFLRTHKEDDDPHVNSYVQDLIGLVDQAASEVHRKVLQVKPPIVMPTPYGGRLIWTLPGKTKMIAHLKDKAKIRAKKRWSQVMYMYYLLGYKLMEEENLTPERVNKISENTYLLALDGDIDFQPNAVHLLVDYMKRNKTLGAACGRIHPMGAGAMAWYQKFEYAIGHWMQKATEHVIGCVLCSPGCFSLFRGQALMAPNVMAKYTTVSTEPLHYVQFDQGEDRWLCTLLLQRGYRVEYSAASDAYTHCPEGFNEFYNQRRRWMPSTIANIFDLLGDYERTVKINDNISTLYVYYQMIMMIGTVIGPGTIFLMLVGAFVAAFKLDQWSSFGFNLLPILIFIIVCATCKSQTQLFFAGIISAVYGLIMMAVFVGVMLQISQDGWLAPSSLFFFCLAGEMILAALLHPKEFNCLKFGVIYYVTVPSMYMLLVIYSIFNMNDVSWGTREVTIVPQAKPSDNKVEEPKKPETTVTKVLSFFGGNNKANAGSIEFSCAGLFKCLCCTHEKPPDEQLIAIQTSLKKLSKKLDDLEEASSIIVEPVSPTQLRPSSASSLRPSSIRTSQLPRNTVKFDLNDEIIDVPKNSWRFDKGLERSPLQNLPLKEETFWHGLLKKYLSPIETENKEKVALGLKDLRDKMVITFFMLNSLFVLVVFLLTLEKDTLHLNWPFDPKVNFSYVGNKDEVHLTRTYLQLEPIGFVFLIFFALLMVVQFIAMLVHRFGTFTQIMANTQIDLFDFTTTLTTQEMYEKDPAKMLKMFMQQNGEDELDDDENLIRTSANRRKTTIMTMENKRRKTVMEYEDMEKNFVNKMGRENILNGPEAIRRKTIKTVGMPTRRSTVRFDDDD